MYVHGMIVDVTSDATVGITGRSISSCISIVCNAMCPLHVFGGRPCRISLLQQAGFAVSRYFDCTDGPCCFCSRIRAISNIWHVPVSTRPSGIGTGSDRGCHRRQIKLGLNSLSCCCCQTMLVKKVYSSVMRVDVNMLELSSDEVRWSLLGKTGSGGCCVRC